MMDKKQASPTRIGQVDEQTNDTSVRRQAVELHKGTVRSVVVARIIWCVTGLITTLLAARVVLQLFGIDRGNGFADFIYELSDIFASPFFRVFDYQPTYGSSTFEVGSIVGLLIYVLVGWVIPSFIIGGFSRKNGSLK